MKRRFLWLAGVAAGIISLFMWVGIASAHSFRTGTNVTTGSNEKIDETLFIAGSTVDVNSEVNGDIFCAGQTVTINGTVHGDVICVGQTVTVNGTVDGNVRLAGQTVTLGASVKGNATVAGQTFTLQSGAKVGGDLTLGATNGVVDGTVGRDLALAGQNVTISSDIGRNVKGNTQKLTLVNGAHIHGNLDYTSQNDVGMSSSAIVDGTTSRTTPVKHASKRGAVFAFNLGAFIYWLLALMAFALVIALLVPRVLHDATDDSLPWPWKALLTGLVAGIAFPVLFIILCITVVGLPMAFLAGLLWAAILLLSSPFMAYLVGRMILQNNTKPLLVAITGAAALAVLLFIPVLGVITFVVTVWIGSGLILRSLWHHWPRPTYNLATTTRAKKVTR